MYRKPTHTDLYLQWDSHHQLSAKFSVINTLRHRGQDSLFHNQLLKEEEDYLNRALSICKYPTLALNRANFTNKYKNIKNSNMNNKPYIVVPYMKGLSERCKNICRKHDIEMFFKEANTISELLVHQKDKDNILKKSGVSYRYKWGTWEYHYPYMTIITPLAMKCLWTISA